MLTENKIKDKHIYGIALLMVLVGVLVLSAGILHKKKELWVRAKESNDKTIVEAVGDEALDSVEKGATEADEIPHNRKLIENFSYQEHEVAFYRTKGAVFQPEDLDVEAVLDIAEEWMENVNDKDISRLAIEICYYWYDSLHEYRICYDDPDTLLTDYSIKMNSATGQILEYTNLTQAKIQKTEVEQYRIATMDTPEEERDIHKEEYQRLMVEMEDKLGLEGIEFYGMALETMGFAEEDANYYIMLMFGTMADGNTVTFGFNQVDKSLCSYFSSH